MAAKILPVYSDKMRALSETISVQCVSDMVHYFNGIMPFYSHHKNDLPSFQMITSQMYYFNHCKQIEVCAFFCVSERGVKRAYKRYIADGPGAFFAPPNVGIRKSAIFTPEKIALIQAKLNEGLSKKEVAILFDIKIDTFNKKLREGSLVEKKT